MHLSSRCAVCVLQICAAPGPPGRRRLLNPVSCDVPVSQNDDCFWLQPSLNSANAVDRSGAPLSFLGVPSTPGKFIMARLMECSNHALLTCQGLQWHSTLC
jgi:hypothetical protein